MIEDIWIWADQQRIIASNYRSDYNIWRRVVIRGDGCNTSNCLGSGNPNVGFTVYNSKFVTTQNIIIADRILNGGSNYGDFATAQHSSNVPETPNEGNVWQGTISINSEDSAYHLEADSSVAPSNILQNVVALMDNGRTGINIGGDKNSIVENFTVINKGSGSSSLVRRYDDTQNPTTRNGIISGNAKWAVVRGGNCSYINSFGAYSESRYYGTSCSDGELIADPLASGLSYPLRVEQGSALSNAGYQGKSYGAVIVKRYGVDGTFYGDQSYDTLTNSALWPYPNENRIKNEMCQNTNRGFCATGSGLYGGQITLTSYIWEYLGNPCPAEICGVGGGGGGGGDTQAPTVPSNLTASAVSSSQINLSWSASTDNVGVTGYRVYRNGIEIATSPSGSYSDNGLTASTNYTYTVSAYDAAGNTSAQSASASAKTSGAGGGTICSASNILCVDDTAGANQEYSTIQTAFNTASAGNTVLVFDGSYAGFQVNKSGNSSFPITIKANGSGANITSPVIVNGESDGIYINDSSYIIIEGFRIQNNPYRCIAARGASPTSPMLGITVRGNTCFGSQHEGFYLSELKNSLIENNTITRTGSNGSPRGHGIYLANAGSDNTTIKGNTIYDVLSSDSACIHVNGDLSVGGDGIISGLAIENNIIHDCAQNALNFDGVQDSIIKNNLTYGIGRSSVRGYKIDAASGPRNLTIVNNTFAGNSSWAIKLSQDLGGHIAFNNVLFGGSGSISVENTNKISSDYNIVNDRFSSNGDSSTISLNSWRSGGDDAHSTISTPSAIFTNASGNDYSLNSNSPAINTGVSSFSSVSAPTSDILSSARPQGTGYDIGAYEYGGIPTTIQGDLNGDNTVNTLDWSIMNSKWNTNDSQADLNKDGVVNTLDWSIMNGNWSV